MPDTLADAVRRTAEIISWTEDATDERVLELLGADGINKDLAQQLLVFVPMAFAREPLEREGVAFPDKVILFSLRTPRRKIVRLSECCVYFAAKSLAYSVALSPTSQINRLLVAGRSAEFHLVNQLLMQGGRLGDIRFVEPAVLLDDIEQVAVAPDIKLNHRPHWLCRLFFFLRTWQLR